jgi:glutathione S-transferase
MAQLEIIGIPQSNFVWSARIACGEKGVPHVNVPAPPHTPAVSDIHPLGQVPVMRHGAVSLFESRAICTYIDLAFEGPPLMPHEPLERAKAEQALSLVHAALDPVLIRRYLFAYMFPASEDGQPNRAAISAVMPAVERHLAIAERLASGDLRSAGGFSLTDAFLTPILFYLKRTPEAGRIIDGSTVLSGYLERQMTRPSVRNTAPPPPPGS